MNERVGAAAALLREAGPDARVRRRPAVWSALEYGCHLRDVLLVQRERVLAALRLDRPDAAAMGRDERAVHDGYSVQDPADVARQLTDAALMFGHVLGRLSAADWDRALVYHYPETAERPLRWVAVHTLHEAQHHLLDIRGQVLG
ncbi:hypothetical protein B2J96_19970 [Mycobacterium shigaense]|nr:hypothetical protein B2J96_19970 [Mycobacterium shigaense]